MAAPAPPSLPPPVPFPQTQQASHAPRTELSRAPEASAHEPPPPLQLQPASPPAPHSQSVVVMSVLLRRLLQQELQEYALPECALSSALAFTMSSARRVQR